MQMRSSSVESSQFQLCETYYLFMARESIKRGQFQPSLKACFVTHTYTYTHTDHSYRSIVNFKSGASRYWPVCRYIRRPDPALGRIVRLVLEKPDYRARDECTFDNSSSPDPLSAISDRGALLTTLNQFLSSSLKFSSPLRFSNDLSLEKRDLLIVESEFEGGSFFLTNYVFFIVRVNGFG